MTSAQQSDSTNIPLRITNLEKQLNTAALYLPLYDQRQYSLQIKELTTQYEAMQKRDKPRGKFSFKNRTVAANANVKKDSGVETGHEQVVVKTTETVINTDTKTSTETTTTSNKTSLTIQDISNTTLRPQITTPTDLIIKNLQNVTINLCNAPITSLHITSLQNCKLITTRIDTSVMVFDCSECVFVMGSRQLRIHRTNTSTFLVFCETDPIIEDCTGLRFGKYPFDQIAHEQSGGTKESLKEWSGIKEEWKDKYRDVKDFNWIKSTKNPNWDLIDDGDYKNVIVGIALH